MLLTATRINTPNDITNPIAPASAWLQVKIVYYSQLSKRAGTLQIVQCCKRIFHTPHEK